MSLQHFEYLSHVISQLSYKWYPPLAAIVMKLPQIESMLQKDWQKIVDSTRDQWATSLPNSCRGKMLANGGELIARAAMEHIHLVRAAKGDLVFYSDDDYPNWLRQIPDPPLCLTVLGDRSIFTRPKVAIIGSRKANGHGLKESYLLGKLLAEKNIAVVSGGALGCDIASHQGALDNEKSPALAICVLAGGLHEFYPKKNKAVFSQIRNKNGLIISERLWWSNSRAPDFRSRNRIIAGLAPVTAVMQAGEKSGALITATYALEQGRELVCLIHELKDVRAKGTNYLIEQGAKCFPEASKGLEVLASLAMQPVDSISRFVTDFAGEELSY
jgi:DNA processing protein